MGTLTNHEIAIIVAKLIAQLDAEDVMYVFVNSGKCPVCGREFHYGCPLASEPTS